MSEFKPKPDAPLGQRFSHVYRARGEPTADSERMRRRIASKLGRYGDSFDRYAEAEIGLATPWSISKSWTTVLQEWSLDDVLNVITILIDYVARNANSQLAVARAMDTLVTDFNRIFEEENVCYRLDKNGGVHFAHDEEFVRSAQATISGLGGQRYVNSLDRFESGMQAISGTTPDGKTGVRNVFESAEGLFRVMFPRSPRLTADQVSLLDPLIQSRYAADSPAASSARKLLASFKDWIEACHFYRHEPGTPDIIAQPPIELAIHLMSVGAAFIRLLIEIDSTNSTVP